jgi:hypothetical protein
MQLVPTWQHEWGSIYEKTFHPDKGRGGYHKWGEK